MAYVARNDLLTYFSEPQLVKMLDDDRDGVEDDGLLATVISGASQDVDGRLATTYQTPFADTAPAKVRAAALIFTCEALYQRRNVPDESNPFKARADYWRKHLDMIGETGTGLDYATQRAFPPVSWVDVPSLLTDNSL